MAFVSNVSRCIAFLALLFVVDLAQAQSLQQDMDRTRSPIADGGLYERIRNSPELQESGHLIAVLRMRREMAGDESRALDTHGILSKERFKALENLALSYRVENDFEDAERLFKELLGLRRTRLGETDRDVLITLNDYAIVIDRQGRDREAEQLYLELIALTRRAHRNDHPDTAVALTNYAQFLHGQQRFGEALALQEEAVRINQSTLPQGDRAALPALNNSGLLLLELGRAEEARQVLSETVAAAGEITLSEQRAPLTVLVNYAEALFALERYQEAADAIEASLLKALPSFDGRIAVPDRDAMSLKGLALYGEAIAKLGRREKAGELLLASWARAASDFGDDHSLTLGLARADARFRLESGNPIGAEGASRGLIAKMRARASGLGADGVRGASQRDRENTGLRATERFFADASWEAFQTYLKQIEEVPSLSESEKAAAKQRLEQEYTNAALDAIVRATANATSSAVGEAAALRFAAQQGFLEIANERKDLVKAWRALEALIVRRQATGMGGDQAKSEGRKKLSGIEARIAEIDEKLAVKAPRYFAILNQNLLNVFGLQMSQPNGFGSKEITNTDALVGKTRECVEQFSAYRTRPSLRMQSLRLCLLQSVLEEDEGLLFLVPSERGTHSFAVSADEVRWARAVMDEAGVREAVEEFRVGLEIQAGDTSLPLFDFKLAHSLFTQLIEPVETVLQGKRRIYVVADGALSRLPLGALVASPPEPDEDPDDPNVLRAADWLADRYALVQLPSVQSLIFIRSFSNNEEAGSADSFAGFGAPELEGEARLRSARSATIDAVDAARLVSSLRSGSGPQLMNPEALRKLSALPGTQGELEQVREALGAPDKALFLADRMTESSIRSADLSRTAILHLATHGFTSEESGATAEPGLVFTPPAQASLEDDGYLAASEVAGLNLSLAQWVILSACNTASPSGKPGETGLSGLAQAFFYAGAQSLLVSHWPVFDDIAPVLTVEALKRSQAGEGRAEALQGAMRKVRNDPALDAAHPAVWAPFALVGEGR